MSIALLDEKVLPEWFSYPKNFLRIADQCLLNFDPWVILKGDDLCSCYMGLKVRYPERSIIPFAAREDNDDIACWDIENGTAVLIIHDYASPGWENRGRFNDFWDWLRSAIEETIIYGGD